jgi:hypothetical protein
MEHVCGGVLFIVLEQIPTSDSVPMSYIGGANPAFLDLGPLHQHFKRSFTTLKHPSNTLCSFVTTSPSPSYEGSSFVRS